MRYNILIIKEFIGHRPSGGYADLNQEILKQQCSACYYLPVVCVGIKRR